MNEQYIVAVSDTHGRHHVLPDIKALHPDALAYIHAGDSEVSEDELFGFVTVRGNNDVFYPMEEHRIISVLNKRILVVHGHQSFMYRMKERMAEMAKDYACELVIYGHTHVFNVETIDDITLINPGSLHYNRDGSGTTYAVIYLEGNTIRVERQNYQTEERRKKWF